MAQQLDNVGNMVGKGGKTRQRAKFVLSHGAWGEMETSVNALIDDLLWPTAAVTRAIAAECRQAHWWCHQYASAFTRADGSGAYRFRRGPRGGPR